jgi:hypothetical protein
MVRIDRQNLAVNSLGLGKLSALMLTHGRGKKLASS